jgi:hypothetical protein
MIYLLVVVPWMVGCGVSSNNFTEMPHLEAHESQFSARERAEIYRVLQLTMTREGQVINACDEVIRPRMKFVELDGEVGTAVIVSLDGGSEAPACYGMTGIQVFMLRRETDSYRMIFSDRGELAVMPTSHLGVRDIALGGPGFEFPVFYWNGHKFVFGRFIRDSEFPVDPGLSHPRRN